MDSIKETVRDIVEGVFDKNGVWNFAAATLILLAITIITVVLFITLPLWILPAWLVRKNTPSGSYQCEYRKYRKMFRKCKTKDECYKLAKSLENDIKSYNYGGVAYRAMIKSYHDRMAKLHKEAAVTC